MANIIRKLGLSSRESSAERDSSKKQPMKLNMEHSPLFARRAATSPERQLERNDHHVNPSRQPLPDVIHVSSDAQKARAQYSGLALDLRSRPGYPSNNLYEPVQRRDRDSDVSLRKSRSSGGSSERNTDSLTPISPLYPDCVGSPFLAHNAKPVAFATPQLSRKVSNAVVFDSAESMLQGNTGADFTAAFEVTHSPRKAISRSVSSTPHPPVTPSDHIRYSMFRASGNSSDHIHSTPGSLNSLYPYEDLSLSRMSSDLSRDSIDRESDHTYQTVNRSNRSSRTESNSSLYNERGAHPSYVEEKRTTSGTLRPPNLPTGMPARKDSLRSITSRPRYAPSSIESNKSSDVISLKEDLVNIRGSKNQWSDRTNKRYTQFLSRNFTSISSLPETKIVQMFRDQFTKNLNLDQTLLEEPPDFVPTAPNTGTVGMSLESMVCTRCGDGFEPQEKIVNSNGQLWHTQCFVCAQCFRAFPDDVFYEFEGRRYCEHDFQVLFAPCCAKCNEFIIGRVIKAMNSNWHPQCFRCNECQKELADLGFIRYMGRAVCHDCNARLKAQSLNKYMCYKCHSVIDGEPLRWRGDTYHPYHFNCANCEVELTHQAREVKSRPGYTANQMNQLYCLRCHDKMGIPICGACRRPIEERVVTALGKHWHVEHFVCIKCEKPFFGNRHYEKKGQAYCETHYHELFGNLCFVCNQVIYGDVVTALNKAWCVHHFACSHCDVKMTQKTKFFEFDQKPICKKCYEKLPQELKKRLKRHHDTQARGGKPAL